MLGVTLFPIRETLPQQRLGAGCPQENEEEMWTFSDQMYHRDKCEIFETQRMMSVEVMGNLGAINCLFYILHSTVFYVF